MLAKDLTATRNENFENMQITEILNSIPSSLDMDATTLRFNGAIKRVFMFSVNLAMDHDLVNR